MEYRRLGRTDIEVSTICMGCWAVADPTTWGEQDEADAIAAIRTSLDAGVTFFDTAEGYGSGYSEELLGKGLAGRRDEAIIATKVSSRHHTAPALTAAAEASLQRLGTDHIDLYMLHWPNHELGFEEPLRTLERLRDAGKVRAIGVSNFARQDLPAILDLGRVEANQLPYSLLWRAIEFDVTPLCRENEVSITCYSPLLQGLLADKFATPDDVPAGRSRTRHFRPDRPQSRHGESGAEDLTFQTLARIRQICADAGVPMADAALAWLAARPGVGTVIVGARNADQARRNAAAVDRRLGDEVLAALTAATEELKQHFGPDNPDMWVGLPGRMR